MSWLTSWHGTCLIEGVLKITILETESAMKLKLEGRITGPWAEELERAWVEASQKLGAKKLTIDLRDVTYADARGKGILRNIVSQTNAELVTGTLWTQYLADEIGTK